MEIRSDIPELQVIKVMAVVLSLKYVLLIILALIFGPGVFIFLIGIFTPQGASFLVAEGLTIAAIISSHQLKKRALIQAALAFFFGLTAWAIDFQSAWLKKFSLFEFVTQNITQTIILILCYGLFRRGLLS